jgi:hypothetical protein
MLVKSEWHALWAAWGQRGRVASNTMGVVSELRTHNAGDQPSTNPHTCSGWTETHSACTNALRPVASPQHSQKAKAVSTSSVHGY